MTGVDRKLDSSQEYCERLSQVVHVPLTKGQRVQGRHMHYSTVLYLVLENMQCPFFHTVEPTQICPGTAHSVAHASRGPSSRGNEDSASDARGVPLPPRRPGLGGPSRRCCARWSWPVHCAARFHTRRDVSATAQAGGSALGPQEDAHVVAGVGGGRGDEVRGQLAAEPRVAREEALQELPHEAAVGLGLERAHLRHARQREEGPGSEGGSRGDALRLHRPWQHTKHRSGFVGET